MQSMMVVIIGRWRLSFCLVQTMGLWRGKKQPPPPGVSGLTNCNQRVESKKGRISNGLHGVKLSRGAERGWEGPGCNEGRRGDVGDGGGGGGRLPAGTDGDGERVDRRRAPMGRNRGNPPPPVKRPPPPIAYVRIKTHLPGPPNPRPK